MELLNKGVEYYSDYGYLSGTTLILQDNGPISHDERYCENVNFVITSNNVLHIWADFYQMGFDFDKLKGACLDEVDSQSINTRKPWFGLGKQYEYVQGWYFLKNRKPKKITLSKWKIIDEREKI